MDVAPSIVLRCTAGPDAGWEQPLRPGRRWLGRADGDLRLADPALEAHHALVDVTPAGDVVVLQTAGRSPLCVDGIAVDGWTRLRPGSVVEAGCSRLEIADDTRRADGHPDLHAGGTGTIHAPLDGSSDDLERFERDLVRVSPALRRTHLELNPADTVEVGVASLLLAPNVLDRTGRLLDPGAWSDPVAAAIERHARHDVPLRIALSPGSPVAVVGPHRDALVASMLGQLGPARRAAVLDLARSEADDFAGVDRPIIVRCDTVDEVPSWCTAVLDVGATWRGTWHPGDGTVVRLHAAARRMVPEPSGALVTEEVARAGAERRSGVVGVPQSARRERQAAAPDAAVELVAESGEDRDLFVEPRLPRARQLRPVLRGRGPPVGE